MQFCDSKCQWCARNWFNWLKAREANMSRPKNGVAFNDAITTSKYKVGQTGGFVMKITKESNDIYTRKVTVEMTEAEWEFITGFSAALHRESNPVARAISRLANGSKPYWEKNLDYFKLFTTKEE